jgi:hypothetical protein
MRTIKIEQDQLDFLINLLRSDLNNSRYKSHISQKVHEVLEVLELENDTREEEYK